MHLGSLCSIEGGRWYGLSREMNDICQNLPAVETQSVVYVLDFWSWYLRGGACAKNSVSTGSANKKELGSCPARNSLINVLTVRW